MLQFPVPQFIEIEDKIIGPFTIKQFCFIFGGGLLAVAMFRIIGNNPLFYFLAIPELLITLTVSFKRFNGRYVYQVIPVFVNFLTSGKVYIFKTGQNTIDDADIPAMLKAATQTSAQPNEIVEPVQSRLKRISLLLDQKNQEEYETLKINKHE